MNSDELLARMDKEKRVHSSFNDPRTPYFSRQSHCVSLEYAKEQAAAIRDLTAKLEAERGTNEKLGKKYADAIRLVNSYVDELQIERDARKKAELQAQALARTVMADQTSHDSGDDDSMAAYNLYERWTKGMKPETPTKTELRQHIQELQNTLTAERKAREEAERTNRHRGDVIMDLRKEFNRMSELLMAEAERLYGERLAFDEQKARAERAESMLAKANAVADSATHQVELLESRLAAVFERTRERCAKALDDLHDKVSQGWDYYSDERADGAHNTLTNGAKAIRALAPEEPQQVPR